MFRFLICLVLGGAIFALVGHQLGIFDRSETPGTHTTDANDKGDTPNTELGAPLFSKVPQLPPPAPVKLDHPVRDPVVFPANLVVMDKVELSAPIPGKILFIGEELPEGAAQVAGTACFVAPPFENASIPGVKEETTFIYRRLYENEVVSNRQIVAKMDITKILGELLVKEGKVSTARANAKAAEAATREALDRYNRAKDLYEKRVNSLEELGAARLTHVKFQEEYNVKVEEAKLAQVEEDQMSILFKQHDIRNDLRAHNARVQKIYKSRSEIVKEQEPIMVVHSLDRLLAEALLDSSQRGRIEEGMRVRVEPIEEKRPIRTFEGHRGEINAVAITNSEEYPKYLSASEDGTVCIWDQFHLSPLRELAHGNPVRALAVSPRAAKHNLALTGTSEGNLYLWDLDKPGSEPKEIRKAHSDSITAVAFSQPDGEFLASGSADGRIQLFRTSDGSLMYPFDSEHGATDPHRGSITSLHFTPHGLLISASRDNTVRMWELKEKGVALRTKPITGRSGTIRQLGVSPDGKWMLLDRGKDLQILSAVDGSRYATLKSSTSGMPFETLALFSPDNSLILTAGAAGGPLQLWRAPDETGRGFEVEQLVTQDRSPVTCAAFSPLSSKGGSHGVILSGSKDANVYLWQVPSPKEVTDHATTGVVKLVAPSEAGSRQIRVGVEVPNPEGRFFPGRPVTIVIE